MLLGRKNESVKTHYSRARIDELQEAVEKVLSVGESTSVIRVIGSAAAEVHANLTQENEKPAKSRANSLSRLVGAK